MENRLVAGNGWELWAVFIRPRQIWRADRPFSSCDRHKSTGRAAQACVLRRPHNNSDTTNHHSDSWVNRHLQAHHVTNQLTTITDQPLRQSSHSKVLANKANYIYLITYPPLLTALVKSNEIGNIVISNKPFWFRLFVLIFSSGQLMCILLSQRLWSGNILWGEMAIGDLGGPCY